MNDQSHRTGLMATLTQRFEGQQLSRILGLKTAVAAGERLEDHDRDFLEALCHEAMHSKPIVDGLPQYHMLFLRTVHLYREISHRALENEKRAFNIA
ncbi:MAG: hypothetical protein WBG92_18355 [Thiohalocapsa sp.]